MGNVKKTWKLFEKILDESLRNDAIYQNDPKHREQTQLK